MSEEQQFARHTLLLAATEELEVSNRDVVAWAKVWREEKASGHVTSSTEQQLSAAVDKQAEATQAHSAAITDYLSDIGANAPVPERP